jgi:hypothetical protein
MILGCFNLLLGICFLSASLGFAPAILGSDVGMVAAFLVFGVSFVPFIATYTELGLNQEDDGAEESERRLRVLSKHMPYWRWSFFACFVAFAVSMFARKFVHPFFVFMASGSFLSAYWFLQVFRVAKVTLEEPNQSPEPTATTVTPPATQEPRQP